MSQYKRTALVLGAGGFIGSHMVKRLRKEGYWVRGVDLKWPEYTETEANAKISLIINNLDDFREERMKDKMERLGITDKLDERLSTKIK